MYTKISAVVVVILTGIVVNTAVWIHQLNDLGGMPLPLSDAQSKGSGWSLISKEEVMKGVEMRIAMQRQNLHMAMKEELEVSPDLEGFIGPPYSDREQSTFDKQGRMYDFQKRLHWWVTGWGFVQFILAPAAMLFALVNVFAHKPVALRIMNGLCVTLCGAAIFSMLVLDYSTAWS